MGCKRFTSGVYFAVLFIACAISASGASAPFELPRQYSAEIESTVGGATSTMKMWVDGNKNRTEMSSQGESVIAITRGDIKRVYSLMPSQKKYMELPMTDAQAQKADPTAIDPKAQWENLGTEAIDGRTCNKYKVTTPSPANPEQSVSTLFYFDAKDNAPVRVVVGEGGSMIVVNYKKFQLGAPDPSVFEIPKDYEKFAMPGVPSGMMPQ